MSLNIYGNIGTTYSGIVTGAELERVSQEVFGGAQIQSGERISSVEPKVNVQPQQQVQQEQQNENLIPIKPIEGINLFAEYPTHCNNFINKKIYS